MIPGATVSILNSTTNVKVSAQTDQYGNYFVQNLNIPGPYRVSVEAAGFRGFIHDGVVLDVDQRLRIDAQLTVGASSDTVEVTAAAATLQTDTSSVGHAMDNTNIVSVPLLQRVGFDLVEPDARGRIRHTPLEYYMGRWRYFPHQRGPGEDQRN